MAQEKVQFLIVGNTSPSSCFHSSYGRRPSRSPAVRPSSSSAHDFFSFFIEYALFFNWSHREEAAGIISVDFYIQIGK